MNKWISTKDKLPETNTDYLVTIKTSFVNYITIISYANDLYKIDKYDFHDKKGIGGWYIFDSEYGFCEYHDVIAWMPLPKPYEGE